MTEGSLCSDECLVRVRAQVMTRDDSTGGWAPMMGGGLSFVALRRLSTTVSDSIAVTLPTKKKAKVQYLITGHRISDESICLECVIRSDLQYNQVTPTFRHWQLQGKKFGLTFQSSGDAKAFDLAMQRALKELKSLSPEPSPTLGKSIASEEESWEDREISTGSEKSESVRRATGRPSRIFSTAPKSAIAVRRSASPQRSTVSVPSPVRYQRTAQVAEPAKRILSLPIQMTKSLSGPLQSRDPIVRTSSAQAPPPPVVRLSSCSHILETSSKELSTPLVSSDRLESVVPAAAAASAPVASSSYQERYTYVDVISSASAKSDEKASVSTVYADPPSGGGPGGASHEYHYPFVEGRAGTPGKRDSISSIKMHNLDMMSSHRPPLLPIKNKRQRSRKRNTYSRGERSRCKYCHEFYSVDSNEYGVCEFAPDKVKECIDKVTCMPAASGLLYCCASETTSAEEADRDLSHPCSCDTSSRHCFWRWLALTALSLILPCLCCYYPLRGCHRLGLRCGCCGGKHEPMT